MDELLDPETDDFEWGPERRRDRFGSFVTRFRQIVPKKRQRTEKEKGAWVWLILVAFGSAALAVGAMSAWGQYNTPAAAAEPVILAVPTATPMPTATPVPTATPLPTATPTPTPIPNVIVHVSGQVASPGIVEVSMLARAYEAVEAAGGALPEADLNRVNLASPIVDGMQLHIPAEGEDDVVPAPREDPVVPTPALIPPTLVPTSTPEPLGASPDTGDSPDGTATPTSHN